MLRKARERGFRPEYVLMDSWYASLKNLKLIASFGWFFLTRLKSNRLVNPDRQGNRPIREVEIPPEGRVVHLKGFGLVRVFRTVSQNGDAEYWATNDLKMTEEKREELEKKGWGIEVYHRGLKQCCGVEQAGLINAPTSGISRGVGGSHGGGEAEGAKHRIYETYATLVVGKDGYIRWQAFSRCSHWPR
jgi:hypothetical protein